MAGGFPNAWAIVYAVTDDDNLQPDRASQRRALAALSDGVFAVTMTLLVLDLKAQVGEVIHSERGLLVAPKLVIYMMSFRRWGFSGSGSSPN